MRSISLPCLASWIRFTWIALQLILSAAFRSHAPPGPHGLRKSADRSPTPSSTTATNTRTMRLRPHHNMVARAVDLTSGDLSWNTLLGEADRAFRWGTQLEKNGQARKASAAFHEACTLYQCFLDSRGEFAHVTSLPESECASVLAYACLRLGFLNQDALGDANAAVRLYKESAAIDPTPSAVSYDGMGESLEASGAGVKLREASDAYRKALQVSPDKRTVQFRLAVALERLGEPEEAERLFEILRRSESTYSCLVDSWGYVRWHTRNIPCRALNLYRGTRDTLELALTAAAPLIDKGGLVCEFGVGSGRSLRMAQEILPLDATLHGFDTFTGLPQPWGTEPAGSYSTGGVVPTLEGRVYFHKGLFRETLPPFLERAGPNAFVAFANVDCDLYSSTLDILEALEGKIVPGTVLVFDEYIGHPTWRYDEFRAWRECCKKFGWKYEYLGFSLSTNQAVVRVMEA